MKGASPEEVGPGGLFRGGVGLEEAGCGEVGRVEGSSGMGRSLKDRGLTCQSKGGRVSRLAGLGAGGKGWGERFE